MNATLTVSLLLLLVGLPAAHGESSNQTDTIITAADVPLEINAPGSYRLAENIVVSSNVEAAILISSDNVTLDLNHHVIRSTTGNGSGVLQNDDFRNLSVHHGRIEGWLHGVGIHAAGMSNSLKDVAVGHCRRGIVLGRSGRVNSCTVSNASVGISTGPDCVLRHCAVFNCNDIGIEIGTGGRISICSVFQCSRGIVARENAVLEMCSTFKNRREGILVGAGGVLRQCSSRENMVGISAGSSVIMVQASAFENSGDGIVAGDDCKIKGTSAALNKGNGIVVNNGCTVTDTAADGNGRAGILVKHSGNQITKTRLFDNGKGLVVLSGGNYIAGNMAGQNANANYDIAADNICGPFIKNGETAPASKNEPNVEVKTTAAAPGPTR